MDKVLITLDREREIKFDYNSVADFEEKSGKTLTDVIIEGKFGPAVVRGLLWAGLRHEDKIISIEQVGRLINEYLKRGGKTTDLVDKVISAIEKSEVFCLGNSEAGE